MGDVVSIDKARDARLKRLYGISIADYDRTLALQGGVCAGCKQPPKPGGRRLHCDHSHKTGKFRGILCWKCNSALKKLRDNPEISYNLYIYLRKAQQEV